MDPGWLGGHRHDFQYSGEPLDLFSGASQLSKRQLLKFGFAKKCFRAAKSGPFPANPSSKILALSPSHHGSSVVHDFEAPLSAAPQPGSESRFRPESITRPAPVLLRYYILCSFALGPMFPVAMIPLICKYITLRYRFDDSGIAMQWGVLFRREIYLTHRRIQDIHLTRNIIQRWFGLATVAVQTASGSATPEMSIEGVLEAEPLRDHLYAKMRGAKRGEDDEQEFDGAGQESLALLEEIRDAMKTLVQRNELGSDEGSHD
jgi:putative membrane protein